MLPPIPAWDAMHPIIVHFPIALLLIAPLLIVFGLVFYSQNRAFMISAFVLMLLGTIAAVVAVATGSAAGELAERVANVESVLENHEELAETTRNIFLALTVIFGAIVFVPMILKKDFARKITLPVTLAFLVFLRGRCGGSDERRARGRTARSRIRRKGDGRLAERADGSSDIEKVR
ncbi:MAG: hypothetical protein IPJ30_16420 [Acidobacteria bacterium]|nr:hypothetical protein [Acidobacteriota bacterium]